MSRPSVFRQQDVTRALRAATAAGPSVVGYEVDPTTGKIHVNTGAPTEKDTGAADLDRWLAKHGHKIYAK
jgi:hypothetical protein